MDAARYQRVKEILLEVLDCVPAQRAARLNELSGGDAALRREVESLLSQQGEDLSGIEDDVRAAVEEVDFDEEVERPAAELPSHIGPYEVLGLLGEGGMGVVYRARQAEPIERMVAVKVIRAGMQQQSILARFDAERRSLARMDHPNIAKVFDAGSDDQGNPYVVMELAEGRSILAYADQHQLGINERVVLFLQVCYAVQHAHERGILHRDLKPSNLIVRNIDGKHQPLVIDFGIAKALEEDTDLQLTRIDQRIGTPAYMSPEQLRGDNAQIDTRSDVYALGVVFYELLAGRHPFGEEPADLAEAEQIRSRTTVSAPSTAASATEEDVARARKLRIGSLRRSLRGDLDNICLMAIRPEPERRYRSVAHFAEDLVRYLDHRPVQARPDNLGYRLSKLRQRHPAYAALSLAAVVFVVAGVAFLAVHSEQLERERDRANVAAAEAEQIAEFMEGLFTNADPVQGGTADLTARELVDAGVDRLREETIDRPETRARLYAAIGRVYHSLALHETAEATLSEALASIDDVDGLYDEKGALEEILGTVLHDQGDYVGAEAAYRSSVESYRRAHPGDYGPTALLLSYVATAIQAQGRLDDAIDPLMESITMGTRVHGVEHADVIWAQNMLGFIQYQQGRYAEALQIFEAAYDAQTRTVEGDDIDVAHTLNNLGGMNLELGNYEAAQGAWDEALAMYQRIYGGDHPAVARALHSCAKVALTEGRIADAAAQTEEAYEMNVRLLGEDHPYTANAMVGMARVLEFRGEVDEAEAMLYRVLATREEAYGADNPRAAVTKQSIAEFHLRQGRLELASQAMGECMDVLTATHSEEHPWLNCARIVVAEIALARTDTAGARQMADLARSHLERTFGPQSEWRQRLAKLDAALASDSTR